MSASVVVAMFVCIYVIVIYWFGRRIVTTARQFCFAQF